MDNFTWILIVYFVVLLVFARTLSAYSPSLMFQSTFELKNKFLYYLLVDRSVTRYVTKSKNKENEQKITLVGVIFYILILIAIVATAVILFALPEVTGIEFDSGKMSLQGDTHNQFCVSLMVISLFCAEIAAYSFNMFDVGLAHDRKVSKAMYIILAVIGILASIGCICGMFSELSEIIYS